VTFYITTPIYYVNDTPHLGHAYTTIVADVLARYHRLLGEETLFLTGTDEHGQKVEQAAKARGLPPKEHCDQMVVQFKEIWKELNSSHDIFMRTTEEFHYKGVQSALQYLFDRGDIYEHTYDGWYSVSEEIFYTEKDLIDGKSPMGKEVTRVSERNYFFRMSKYKDALLSYIETNPNFIQPDHKKSEVLGFLRGEVGDLCISRPKERLSWGIELPFDKNFVTYVWFDALLNYATAIGYRGSNTEKYKKFWPNVVHLIGKDILITHTVYWTTMLLALGESLPKAIFAHGWWLTGDNKKMSKSEGPVVKPLDLRKEIGVDGLRYFLARDVVLGNDAQFSRDLVIQRLNAELSNNLGNLLSRCLNLIVKYFDSKVPEVNTLGEESKILKAQIIELPKIIEAEVRKLKPQSAIGAIIDLLSATNKYIDIRAPWKKAKDDLPHAAETLSVVFESLLQAGKWLSPVMPERSSQLLERLGYKLEGNELIRSSENVTPGDPLFPRLE